MRVIAKPPLRQFWERFPDAKEPLLAWYREAEASVWRTPADIRAKYGTASFVGQNRVVFNIRGNHYRLIVHVNYAFQVVYIRFVGTHREYDKVDATKV